VRLPRAAGRAVRLALEETGEPAYDAAARLMTPGHDAEAQGGGEQAHDPDEPGQDAHQPEVVGAVVAGQPGDRAGGD
jgi:hypothetical protein